MDTAYVRENPPQKWPYKVQYLHFRYLDMTDPWDERFLFTYTPGSSNIAGKWTRIEDVFLIKNGDIPLIG